MNKLITNNPYRLLGIYSNSPARDKVANMGKLKAFMNIGKSVSFPLDLDGILTPITGTEEAISDADAKLTLPADQLKHAQYWFMKEDQFDEIAFKQLFAGDFDKALEIWGKKDTVSSLQNRIVCALIKDDFSSAIKFGETLYSQFADLFVSTVAGKTIKADNLSFNFLDGLISEINVNRLLPHITKDDWRKYLNSAAINPILDEIKNKIDIAKSSRGKGSEARHDAGVKLINETKSLLAQLNQFLSTSDLQYQITVDKLANEILQCGIDYFNDSEDDDAPNKAMVLQSYAQSIAVGNMTKQRCDENVGILKKIIKELPPIGVRAEDRAIKEELRKFCNLPDKISHSITLLNNTKPHLKKIKSVLGSAHKYYLKISTDIVGNALHNVIEEVNKSQEDPTITLGGQEVPITMLMGESARYEKMKKIKDALRQAWDATKIMDTFDMEPDFKTDRYDKNRSVLKSLCQQVGISTSTYSSSSSSSSSSISKPAAAYTPHTSSSSPSSGSSSSSSSSEKNNGWAAFWIATIITAIIGAMVNGGEGFMCGAILGALLPGQICKAIFSD